MNILIIGGTGFVGSAVARKLAAQGHVLCLPTRRRDRAKHLTTLPTAAVVEADVHDPAVLARLMRDQDAVISMAGILRGNFSRVHAELPAKIVTAAKSAGIRRIVHVSSLGAAADAPSAYQRSKAAGEAALQGKWPRCKHHPSLGDLRHGRQFPQSLRCLAALFPDTAIGLPASAHAAGLG